MKVTIAYPPIPSEKGVPLLSQNRQFQWFNRPTYIYPMVPAYAATLAAKAGYEVNWMDGIASGWTLEHFLKQVTQHEPDLMLIEAKTPIIKSYWRTIDTLKSILPAMRIALCGDHVTALPEESMRNCRVDFVLTGGDYDFLLMAVLHHIETHAPLPGGVYFRDHETVRNTGSFSTQHDLNTLPLIDRELTQWHLYSRQNGNFRYPPGTYTMCGRDCWWGKCRFCSWTTLYPNWRTQTPERALNEIGHVLATTPVREIFDDTGTFPAGQWLRQFCHGMLDRGYHKRVVLGCNMIPGILSQELYELMAAANFRFVLFGLESAEQSTLERICKCGKTKDIEDSMRMAKMAGLEPHVTCMVGYPWETAEQAARTVALTRHLFDRGYIDTLQATMVIPYPGTPLFRECDENGWLRTKDWNRYDMREPIMQSPMTDSQILALTRGVYRSFLGRRFIWRKIKAIRRPADIAYYFKATLRVIAHLFDFRRNRPDSAGP